MAADGIELVARFTNRPNPCTVVGAHGQPQAVIPACLSHALPWKPTSFSDRTTLGRGWCHPPSHRRAPAARRNTRHQCDPWAGKASGLAGKRTTLARAFCVPSAVLHSPASSPSLSRHARPEGRPWAAPAPLPGSPLSSPLPPWAAAPLKRMRRRKGASMTEVGTLLSIVKRGQGYQVRHAYSKSRPCCPGGRARHGRRVREAQEGRWALPPPG